MFPAAPPITAQFNSDHCVTFFLKKVIGIIRTFQVYIVSKTTDIQNSILKLKVSMESPASTFQVNNTIKKNKRLKPANNLWV